MTVSRGDTYDWHETDTLVTDEKLGRLGASWFLLDNSGRVMSDSYHEIYPTRSGYVGKEGGSWYRIDANGKRLKKLTSEDDVVVIVPLDRDVVKTFDEYLSGHLRVERVVDHFELHV